MVSEISYNNYDNKDINDNNMSKDKQDNELFIKSDSIKSERKYEQLSFPCFLGESYKSSNPNKPSYSNSNKNQYNKNQNTKKLNEYNKNEYNKFVPPKDLDAKYFGMLVKYVIKELNKLPYLLYNEEAKCNYLMTKFDHGDIFKKNPELYNVIEQNRGNISRRDYICTQLIKGNYYNFWNYLLSNLYKIRELILKHGEFNIYSSEKGTLEDKLNK